MCKIGTSKDLSLIELIFKEKDIASIGKLTVNTSFDSYGSSVICSRTSDVS